MKKMIYIKHPNLIPLFLDKKRIINLNDKKYLELLYYRNFNKKLDLNNPKTFNEKLQWLKIYDRKPEYTKMVDKYEAKKYVEEIIGEEYIIPTLGIYERFEDIDFETLPNQFVLKCTHDSGGLVICKDKTQLRIEEAREKINKSLKRNYYYSGREWPYKNVKPKIIVEQYIENSNGKGICDYKFYCFDGKVDYTMICTDRETGNTKFYYVDREGKLKRKMSKDGLKLDNEKVLNTPDNLDEMFSVAEKLSKGIKFVRIDLYNIDGKIYFGEFTFFPSSGFDRNRTEEAENYLNNMLKL